MRYLWLTLGGIGGGLLLFAVIWTAFHSMLFLGCLVLALSVTALVAVWGNQSERL